MAADYLFMRAQMGSWRATGRITCESNRVMSDCTHPPGFCVAISTRHATGEELFSQGFHL
jgi:hypothetical protein